MIVPIFFCNAEKIAGPYTRAFPGLRTPQETRHTKPVGIRHILSEKIDCSHPFQHYPYFIAILLGMYRQPSVS
jgi:hypothetical protein